MNQLWTWVQQDQEKIPLLKVTVKDENILIGSPK